MNKEHEDLLKAVEYVCMHAAVSNEAFPAIHTFDPSTVRFTPAGNGIVILTIGNCGWLLEHTEASRLLDEFSAAVICGRDMKTGEKP